ncbi:ABC transporter substrate-binding protein [Rhizobium sp. NRK18]|uniref:ABC transporter substrate-binding protein n=1 Tax=Rhizobium sp. NRK18 TaxID=2964667 RepID=UPI0021C3DE37|nr:sugar ABC transporter substrate-binding protein [Rhizobium sp. NRK18]MCQ2006300.1 sugar ABC transporter substrate-binding protein [Rhizobium sp. NRK18]
MRIEFQGVHRRSLRRLSLALAASLFALPALAGDITVLLPGDGYAPDVLQAFEKDTGIHVDQQTLAWDQLHTRIITALVAGTAPADVIELDWSWVGQFGAAGWLEPLDGKVEQSALDEISVLPIFKYDGKIVGAPYNNDFKMMVVNTDHLKKAGIDKVPRTMDELLAAGKAIKEKGITKYPFGLPLSVGEATSTAWYLITMMYGGTLFDANGEPAFTDPSSGGYKALQFIKQAIDDGLIDPASTAYGNPEVREAFKAGDISFILSDGPGPLATYNDKEKSRVAGNSAGAVVPNVTGKTETYGLPEALAIPAASTNKEDALKFINYVMGKDAQVQSYLEHGTLPTRKDALMDLNGKGKLESGDAIVEQVSSVNPLFAEGTPPWYPPFSNAAASAVNAVATGQMTVPDAIASIAKAAKSAMNGN